MVHLDYVTQPNQLPGLMCKLFTQSNILNNSRALACRQAGALGPRGKGLTRKTLGLDSWKPAGHAVVSGGSQEQWAPGMDNGAD